MARINDHYLKLAAGYLFPEIARRVNEFQAANPGAKLIRLEILNENNDWAEFWRVPIKCKGPGGCGAVRQEIDRWAGNCSAPRSSGPRESPLLVP